MRAERSSVVRSGGGLIGARQAERFSFSLVELIVAMAVTLLLMGLLLQVFLVAMKGWQRAQERNEASREACAALHLLSRDMSHSLRHLMSTNVAIVAGDPSANDDRRHAMLYALSVQSGSEGRVGRGDLWQVGFYCAWDARDRGYHLRRTIYQSEETFRLIKAGAFEMPPPGFRLFPPGEWHVRGAVLPVLASYTWDFQVRLPDPQNLSQAGRIEPGSVLTFTDDAPAWIEVSFKSVSPAVGRRLRESRVDRAVWLDPQHPSYSQWIAPHVQQFRSRIPLP